MSGPNVYSLQLSLIMSSTEDKVTLSVIDRHNDMWASADGATRDDALDDLVLKLAADEGYEDSYDLWKQCLIEALWEDKS